MISNAATRSNSCVLWITIGCVLVIIGAAALWKILYAPGPDEVAPSLGSESIFHVSPETTVITKTLKVDGDPDYVPFLNQQNSEGITLENNSVVLPTQAFGPRTIYSKVYQDEFHKRQ